MKLPLAILTTTALFIAQPAAAQDNTPAAQATQCATQPIEHVLTLMKQRLELARDVARYKWNTQGKIEDLAREQMIIAGLEQQAVNQGLPADWAKRFFRAQIEASKRVQRELFEQWRKAQAGRFDDTPDLATVTRPKLDALTSQLIAALANAWPQLQTPACNNEVKLLTAQKLKQPDYDAVTVGTAGAPLLEVTKP